MQLTALFLAFLASANAFTLSPTPQTPSVLSASTLDNAIGLTVETG